MAAQDRCPTVLLSYTSLCKRLRWKRSREDRVRLVLSRSSAYEEADVPTAGSNLTYSVCSSRTLFRFNLSNNSRGLRLELLQPWRHDLCPVTWLPGTKLRRTWIWRVSALHCLQPSAILLTCIAPGRVACFGILTDHNVRLRV